MGQKSDYSAPTFKGAHSDALEAPKPSREHRGVLAGFSLLYESRDRRLCVFEDAAGHLTSVRASRLA